jgi:hypothetical protein
MRPSGPVISRLGFTLSFSVAAAAFGLLGCAEGELDADPGSAAVPADTELRQGAVTTLRRGYMQAVLSTNGKIMLAWTDNKDPATGQPGTINRPWTTMIDPQTGGIAVAPQTYETRPSYDGSQKTINWARLAVGDGQILMAYSWTFGDSDHDVLGLMLSPTTGAAMSSNFTISGSGIDDQNAYPAYQPGSGVYLVAYERVTPAPSGAVRSETAQYITPGGVGAAFSLDPDGPAHWDNEGDATFADGRFVSSVDGWISSIIPGQTVLAGHTSSGVTGGHQELAFDATSHTIGAVSFSNNVFGGPGYTTFLSTYSTQSCYANQNCSVYAAPIYSSTSTVIPGTLVSPRPNGFFVFINPTSQPSLVKVISTDTAGGVTNTKQFTASCNVANGLESAVATPYGTWLFWTNCNQQIKAIKLDATGQAVTSEILIN